MDAQGRYDWDAVLTLSLLTTFMRTRRYFFFNTCVFFLPQATTSNDSSRRQSKRRRDLRDDDDNDEEVDDDSLSRSKKLRESVDISSGENGSIANQRKKHQTFNSTGMSQSKWICYE